MNYLAAAVRLQESASRPKIVLSHGTSLPGTTVTAASTTTLSGDLTEEVRVAATDYVNNLDLPGLPPNRLKLKVNGMYFVMHNISPADTIANFTSCQQYIVSRINMATGETVHFPRISFSENVPYCPLQLHRRQFPVQLAYALTIHKSQRGNLDRAGVDSLWKWLTASVKLCIVEESMRKSLLISTNALC